jgi:hypothetical protein
VVLELFTYLLLKVCFWRRDFEVNCHVVSMGFATWRRSGEEGPAGSGHVGLSKPLFKNKVKSLVGALSLKLRVQTKVYFLTFN